MNGQSRLINVLHDCKRMYIEQDIQNRGFETVCLFFDSWNQRLQNTCNLKYNNTNQLIDTFIIENFGIDILVNISSGYCVILYPDKIKELVNKLEELLTIKVDIDILNNKLKEYCLYTDDIVSLNYVCQTFSGNIYLEFNLTKLGR